MCVYLFCQKQKPSEFSSLNTFGTVYVFRLDERTGLSVVEMGLVFAENNKLIMKNQQFETNISKRHKENKAK